MGHSEESFFRKIFDRSRSEPTQRPEMIQHSPGTTTKRGPPPRTMSTRQSAKAPTSGSGEQNPVAPNTTRNQEEDEDLAPSRRSISPPSGRCSRSAPHSNKNTAHVVFLQPEVLTRQDRQQVSHIAPVVQQTTNQPNLSQRSPANDAPAPETIAAQNVTANLEGPINHAINSLPIDWTSLIRAIRAPLPTLPTFTGQDHEDPDAFLRECEEHFTQSATEPSQWTRLAGKSLGESAAKWWEMYKSLSLTWYKFREVMLQRYASASTLMRLRA